MKKCMLVVLAIMGVSAAVAAAPEEQELAGQILNSSDITLAPYHESGEEDNATARQNIRDTAAGRPASRSAYDNGPGGTVRLSPDMLRGMLQLANNHGYSFTVSEIAGGSHSPRSRHYDGVAFDVNIINGSHVSSANTWYRGLMAACRALGATEVLGPGDPGHATHVHCAWPRP